MWKITHHTHNALLFKVCVGRHVSTHANTHTHRRELQRYFEIGLSSAIHSLSHLLPCARNRWAYCNWNSCKMWNGNPIIQIWSPILGRQPGHQLTRNKFLSGTTYILYPHTYIRVSRWWSFLSTWIVLHHDKTYSSSNYIGVNRKQLCVMNWKGWVEAAVTWFEVISWHLCGGRVRTSDIYGSV
jgi:hypothetical protein